MAALTEETVCVDFEKDLSLCNALLQILIFLYRQENKVDLQIKLYVSVLFTSSTFFFYKG